MRLLYTIAFSFFIHLAYAQTVADFEAFDLPIDTFLNGSDESGGFSDGNIFLPNNYTAMWDSWSGWAISSTTDYMTEGFTNQYSVIAGKGFDGSPTYATTFVSGESKINLEGDAAGGVVNGLYINNATYAFLSIQNGDAFAKKFGGETGNDPDFFRLTIKKYLNGNLGQDSIDFYLADYRFDDNSLDYIVKDWTYLDLTSLGNIDSLSFSLASSDNGAFGMNTPGYFCIDNLETADDFNTSINSIENKIKVFPNPAFNSLNIETANTNDKTIKIYNSIGQLVSLIDSNQYSIELSVEGLEKGIYWGILEEGEKLTKFSFVKN